MKKTTYSLKESPQFQAIAEITREHGSNELVDDLSELVYLLNAPPSLTKFLYLCRKRIPRILSHADEVEADGFSTETLEPAKRWIEWFNSNIELFDSQPITRELLRYSEAERHKNPLYGWGMTRFGMYSALFYSSRRDDLFDAWARLAMLLWLAQVNVLKSHFGKDQFETFDKEYEFLTPPYSIYKASCSLRQLTNSVAEGFLTALVGEGSIRGALYVISRDSPQIDSIDSYVAKALGGAEWRIKAGGGGGGRRGGNLPPGYIDLGDGVEVIETAIDEGPSVIDFPGQQFTPKIIDEIIEVDLDPDEFVDGGKFSLFEAECESTNKNVMSRLLAARGRQQHIRMHNQLLPFQFNQLTLGEVVELYKYLAGACDTLINKGIYSEIDSDGLEAPLLILVMLVTGSSLERAVKLTVLKKENKKTSDEVFLYPHEKRDDGVIPYEWGFRAFEPKYAADSPYDKSLRKDKVRNFYLPDFLAIGPYVAFYKDKSTTNNKKSKRVFQKKVESYERSIRKYLRTIPEDVSDRLTIKNISSYLLYQISAATNDITAASCITSQGHSLAGTRIHYTVLSVDYLRSVTKKALSPLLRGLGQDPEKIEVAKTRYPIYVGARHCLTKEACNEAVEQVIKVIRTNKTIRTLEDFVSYHNIYTAYTAWMFNFSIAGRANTNPLIRLDQFDFEEAITTYRDKDLETPYHARLTWLPPEVLKQLKNYEEHLSAVRCVAALYRDINDYQQYAEYGFFLRKDLVPDVIRPATMREVLYAHYLDAPHNSHRRFIRSELIEIGHDTESIDALMGHWFAGEEPWSYFSTFDFHKHIDYLNQNLVSLMDEIGFRACRSNLLAGKL